GVVVDLPVKDDLHRAVLVAERLRPAGQVDDRQAAVDQADARLPPQARAVRAAVGDGATHRLQKPGLDRSGGVRVEDAGYAAHGQLRSALRGERGRWEGPGVAVVALRRPSWGAPARSESQGS